MTEFRNQGSKIQFRIIRISSPTEGEMRKKVFTGPRPLIPLNPGPLPDSASLGLDPRNLRGPFLQQSQVNWQCHLPTVCRIILIFIATLTTAT